PQRRYQSTWQLAEDLARFGRGQPVSARPLSPVTRLTRWCRRYPWTAALLGVLAVVLVASFRLVPWKWREADPQRGQAELQALLEKQARETADEARGQAQRLRLAGRRDAYASNVHLAWQAWGGAQVDYMHQLLEEAARGQPGDEDLRGFEWHY